MEGISNTSAHIRVGWQFVAVDTYSNLKAEIATHLDRDDLTSQIDTFIDLAEARHKRDIRIRQMITREALTVDARYVAIPDGFLEGISLRLSTDPVTVVDFVSVEEMNRQTSTTSGKPRYYTTHAEFEFDKAPDATYTGQIVYYKEVSALSDSVATNAILERAPDAYLYGALLASAPFLVNDERIETWGALYRSVIDGLSVSKRQERSMGRQVSRVSGATP